MQTVLHVRNVARDMVLMLVTCGLFNVYIQDRQILALNDILREPRYSFTRWCVLTLVTCGLYHVYYEYCMSMDLKNNVPGVPDYEPLLTVVLTVLGFSILVDAIQQGHINRYFTGVKA